MQLSVGLKTKLFVSVLGKTFTDLYGVIEQIVKEEKEKHESLMRFKKGSQSSSA